MQMLAFVHTKAYNIYKGEDRQTKLRCKLSKNANLYIRIDQNVKTDAEELFSSFGITVTDAVNMFLHKALMVRGIPFDVVQPRYNATTEAAMGEIAEMRSGKTPKDSKSVADFAKEMGIE